MNVEKSYMDKSRADKVVTFISLLKHTKGVWHGKPFILLPWQEKIIRDLFGTIKENGYRQYNYAYVEIPKKQGKQLSLDTLIPTPSGYVEMGDIEVGDNVFDENGKVSKVIAISEIDDRENAYKISFRNGEDVTAGANHLWNVEFTKKKFQSEICRTEDLYKMQIECKNTDQRALYRIPIAMPFVLPETALPLDPYTYGFWIGNGCATKPELTINGDDINKIIGHIPYEIHNRYKQEGNSEIVVYKELKKILVPHYKDKRIEKSFLRASHEQRTQLLQGLMDSDGSISKSRGQGIYCTILKELAEDVSELLWSLGIKNSTNICDSTRYSVSTGEKCYNVKFTCFDDFNMSVLERKLKNRIDRNRKSRTHYHYIKSIEKTDKTKMRCIQVDSKSHEYLITKSMIPTHNSELAAAIALYLMAGDGEWGAEVYGCAADRQQASIVFDVAVEMVEQCPALKKRVKPILSQKRLVYTPLNSFYQVLSAESYTKHGLNVHGVIFDELHAQPNRALYDVMLHGSGDARKQPLFFQITTSGTDRHSICYEVHQKAKDVIAGKRIDPTFYPLLYGIEDDDDWSDEKNWYKANPSLDVTVDIDKLRVAYLNAKDNPAEENLFRQLRLNQWVKQSIRWMPMDTWDKCNFSVDEKELEGRDCFGGLDLSSSIDVTAFVLVFPPRNEEEKYMVLPYFWIPEETVELRVRRDHVPYDVWKAKGSIMTTEGNVIHYGFIEKFIEELGLRFHIKEIAYDRWGAVQMSQNLECLGFTIVPFGQGYKDMSPPTKELMKLTLEKKIAHGGNEPLRWMMDNIFVRTDPAGNIKADKEKSTERIDGAVATIMALDRAIRNQGTQDSVYNDRGILIL